MENTIDTITLNDIDNLDLNDPQLLSYFNFDPVQIQKDLTTIETNALYKEQREKVRTMLSFVSENLVVVAYNVLMILDPHSTNIVTESPATYISPENQAFMYQHGMEIFPSIKDMTQAAAHTRYTKYCVKLSLARAILTHQYNQLTELISQTEKN